MKVFSFFSGVGGNTLGYRLAGLDVVYANEILESSADTYEHNFKIKVDRRDIRKINGTELIEKYGQPDIIDGSPPCASYSMAGSREKGYGKAKLYAGEYSQRTDDLLDHYIRICLEIKPNNIVFENVTGLTRGRAFNVLKSIKEQLEANGYNCSAFIVNASDQGVPQDRRRLFFRASLLNQPTNPISVSKGSPIKEAIGKIENSEEELAEVNIARFATGKEWKRLKQGEQSKKYFSLLRTNPNKICPTITAKPYEKMGAAGITHYDEPRVFTYPELLKLSGFPDNFEFIGNRKQARERLGRIVCPPSMKAIAETIKNEIA